MANNDYVVVKVTIDPGLVRNFLYSPTSDIGIFRRAVGLLAVQQAQNLAQERLSSISGPRHSNFHRPFAQPGRTGEYDKKFKYRTYVGAGGIIAVSLTNSSPYAVYVERGTSRTNYLIPKTPKRISWYSYASGTWRFHTGPVIHPGPWRSGTANSKGRAGRAGEVAGFGSYILNDAMKIAARTVLGRSRRLS